METFARYLARQFIANKEYSARVVPEAAPLVAAADIVLMRSDGMTLTLMCVIDREANPSKQFLLTREQVEEIGSRCLKYAGKINSSQMPVIIQIVEVGPSLSSSADRERVRVYRRKSLRSKVLLFGILIDTTTRRIWSNGLLRGWAYRHSYMGKLLREPRETEVLGRSRPRVIPAPQRTPIVTYTLIALLAAVFGTELLNAIGPVTGLGAPSLQTLIAFGGLNRALVLESHEWYRVLTAILLHGNIVHLAMNGLSLLLVGMVLENLVGRLWFTALFILGGLCGSAMSLAFNGPNITSVGASGAIIALFTAAFVCSFRLPLASGRTHVQMQLARVIVPALIPLATTQSGGHIDFGAHLGGALGGTVMGFILLKQWEPASPYPRFRALAGTITAAGCTLVLLAGVAAVYSFPRYGSAVTLIPDAQLPKTTADAGDRVADLVARFPDDPRSHWLNAVVLVRANRPADAESELHVALSKWEPAKWQLRPEFGVRLQVMLAEVLVQEHRIDEARSAAAPACSKAREELEKGELSRFRLCG